MREKGRQHEDETRKKEKKMNSVHCNAVDEEACVEEEISGIRGDASNRGYIFVAEKRFKTVSARFSG